MSDIMASIGIEQLKKFDKKFKKKRKELHLYYRTQLKDCQNITLFETDIKNVVPHIFPIKVKSNKVDILKKELKRNNIPTGLHYKPNHLLSYFKVRYSLPNAEKLYKELVTLPFHVDLTIDEVKNICQIIKKVI